MPRGGARPGAGRPRKVAAEVLPAAPVPVVDSAQPAAPKNGARPTFGQLLANLQPGQGAAPPAPGEPVTGQLLDADTGAPVVREENRSFANLMGYVGTNVGVLVIGDHLRRKGFDPREPGPEDLERTTDATAEAIAMAIGDAAIPWWGTLAAAWGNLYLAMRVGARQLSPDELAQRQAQAEQVEAPPPPPTAPPGTAAPVMGQPVPIRANAPRRPKVAERSARCRSWSRRRHETCTTIHAGHQPGCEGGSAGAGRAAKRSTRCRASGCSCVRCTGASTRRGASAKKNPRGGTGSAVSPGYTPQ